MVGCIAGWLINSSMVKCYSYNCQLEASQNAGGLVGISENGKVYNSYSLANIKASKYNGGLIGQNNGSAYYCYAAGVLTGSKKGCFYTSDVAEYCYYDINTTGAPYIDDKYGIDLTTEEFAAESSFQNWDFNNIWMIAKSDLLDNENMRPYLRWQLGYTYQVNFISDENGSIDGFSTQTIEEGSSSIGVTAVPNENYTFTEWQDEIGNIYSTSNPLVIDNINSNINLKAAFSINTGVNNYQTQKLNAYPNPTNGVINFELPDNGDNCTLTIYSIAGVKIECIKNFKDSTFNLSLLPKDIYMVELKSVNTIFVDKIMKN